MGYQLNEVPCPSCGELRPWIYSSGVCSNQFGCDCGYYYSDCGQLPPEEIWPDGRVVKDSDPPPHHAWNDYLAEQGREGVGDFYFSESSGGVKSDDEIGRMLAEVRQAFEEELNRKEVQQ